jgi:hypothetical protein
MSDSGRPNIDPDQAKSSLDRLFEIYKDIAATADEVMESRCPYKDAKGLCNAKFSCRNQFFPNDPTSLPVCSGSDSIDYREAWEE